MLPHSPPFMKWQCGKEVKGFPSPQISASLSYTKIYLKVDNLEVIKSLWLRTCHNKLEAI